MERLRYVSNGEGRIFIFNRKMLGLQDFFFSFFFFSLPCIFKRKKEKFPAIKGICQEQPPASTTNEQLQCENTFKVLNELSLW